MLKLFKKKRREYSFLIPPLDKPIDALSKAEAQAFFDWYISKLDERTEYLRSFTGLDLDYSSQSLIDLWSWFLKRAEVEKTPEEILTRKKNALIEANLPIWEHVLAADSVQLSKETIFIMTDVSMYLGQVFTKNYPSIYWSFYTRPKNDIHVNQPLLLGFPNEIFPEKKRCSFLPDAYGECTGIQVIRRQCAST